MVMMARKMVTTSLIVTAVAFSSANALLSCSVGLDSRAIFADSRSKRYDGGNTGGDGSGMLLMYGLEL
jgi:hypothetical protein